MEHRVLPGNRNLPLSHSLTPSVSVLLPSWICRPSIHIPAAEVLYRWACVWCSQREVQFQPPGKAHSPCLYFFLTHLHVAKHTLKTNRLNFLYVCMCACWNMWMGTCVSVQKPEQETGCPGLSLSPLLPWGAASHWTWVWTCGQEAAGVFQSLPPPEGWGYGCLRPCPACTHGCWTFGFFLMLVQQVHLPAQPSPKLWPISF